MTTQQPLMAPKRPLKFNFRQLIGQFQISDRDPWRWTWTSLEWRHRWLSDVTDVTYIFDTKYDTIKNVYIDFKVWKSKKVLHF